MGMTERRRITTKGAPNVLRFICIFAAHCGTATTPGDAGDGANNDAEFQHDIGSDQWSTDASTNDLVDTPTSNDVPCREPGALYCGASCNRCTAAPNATPHCDGNECSANLQCIVGFADCDRALANGCEVNTNTDVANCGGCATRCPSVAHGTATCVSAACSIVCERGFQLRDNRCVLPPPGLRAPQSATVVYGERPTFRWTRSDANNVEYRIQVCSARSCEAGSVLEEALTLDTTYIARTPIATSRHRFWRVAALVAGTVESISPTWEFRVVPRLGRPVIHPPFVQIFDLNGDGAEEIAIDKTIMTARGVEGGVAVLAPALPDFRPPTPTLEFAPAAAYTETATPQLVGDLNGDGLSDLAIARVDGQQFLQTAVVLGRANLGDVPTTRIVTRHRALPVPVGDVNSDGFQDVVIVEVDLRMQNRIALCYGSVAGDLERCDGLTDWGMTTWRPLRTLNDFDSDGRPELYLTDGMQYEIRSWGGDRLAVRPIATYSANDFSRLPYDALALGDVNGDGNADLAFGLALRVTLGGVDTLSQSEVPLVADQLGPTPIRLMAMYPTGDLNGDGIDDIAVNQYAGNLREQWLAVYLGSTIEAELAAPDYHVQIASPARYSATRQLIHFGAAVGDYYGNGLPQLALGFRPSIVWVADIPRAAVAGDPPVLRSRFQIDSGDFGILDGARLVLAPSLAPRHSAPTRTPSTHFLQPSLEIFSRYRWLFSLNSHTQSSMGGHT